MNRFVIFLISLLSHLFSVAQLVQEHVLAETDRTCYVVGEHIRLAVRVDLPDGTPSPSRVAYVEIADTMRLHNQTMLTLDGGIGYGEIPLTPDMHSGAYQLCVYTRGLRNFGEQAFFTTDIGVINPVKLSADDDISFIPADDGDIIAEFEPVTISDPGIETPPAKPAFGYELEGHIVTAHVESDGKDIDNIRLAIVGETTKIYDGRATENGNYDFYTTGVYGDCPTFVSAYSPDGKSLPTRLVSPYAGVLPSQLPRLIVHCSEKALKQRYSEALRQVAIDEWQHTDPQPLNLTFMSTNPRYVYDLDEWTRMDTVDEMLTEFIRGVHVKRTNGVPQLYMQLQCPALVLFDGIPVYDVQTFLDYDPRYLKYVQIYDDRYTFGQTYCYGVVSFISRSGKLPNYKLDEGSTLVTYQFPKPYQIAK